jgi:hypothetical protein
VALQALLNDSFAEQFVIDLIVDGRRDVRPMLARRLVGA